MNASLVVLAAGMGSRYGGLKQLDGFGPNSKTLLEYNLYDAFKAGFDTVIFIIRKEFESEFTEKVVSTIPESITVCLVDQSVDSFLPDGYSGSHRLKPRGTGHALLCAKEYIDQPFAVINADDYYGPKAFQQMYSSLTSPLVDGECILIGYILRQTLSPYGSVNRGICHVDGGSLVDINECLGIEEHNGIISSADGLEFTGDEIVSMNFFGFTPAYLGYLEDQFSDFVVSSGSDPKKEFYIPSSCNSLVQSGDLHCQVDISSDLWCGVTYQEDKKYVNELLSKLVIDGLYPKNQFFQ